MRQSVSDYPEDFVDIVDAYIASKMFEPAVEILERLVENESTNTDQTWSRMATCAKELGDLEKSAKLLEDVLEHRPHDMDAALELGQVYAEMGDANRALQLVNRVEAAMQAVPENEAAPAGAGALIEVEAADKRASSREKARKAEEEQAILTNKTNFQRCKLLWGKWNEGEATDADQSDFLKVARKLVQRFQTTKAFYPSDRAKRFSGVGRKKRAKPGTSNAQQALTELANKLKKRSQDGEKNYALEFSVDIDAPLIGSFFETFTSRERSWPCRPSDYDLPRPFI